MCLRRMATDKKKKNNSNKTRNINTVTGYERKVEFMPGVVIKTCVWEVEVGELGVQGQPWLHETLLMKQNPKTNKKLCLMFMGISSVNKTFSSSKM